MCVDSIFRIQLTIASEEKEERVGIMTIVQSRYNKLGQQLHTTNKGLVRLLKFVALIGAQSLYARKLSKKQNLLLF